MVPNSRLRFRPQVEVLEDRALPNNFFSGADGFGVNPLDKHKDDDQQIFRAVNALNAQQNPAVMPVQSHPFGASYAEWSARWW